MSTTSPAAQDLGPIPPKVRVGLGTILGIIGAVGQYAAAVALFLSSVPDEAGITALVTATLTLIRTIDGRMGQAREATRAVATVTAAQTTGTGTTPSPATAIVDQAPRWAAIDELGTRVELVEQMVAAERGRNRDTDKTSGYLSNLMDEDDDHELAAYPAGLAYDDDPDPDRYGPAEADGDEALDPSYPGRLTGPGHEEAEKIAARLELEREGDVCAAHPYTDEVKSRKAEKA
jgi:hypothetical protein